MDTNKPDKQKSVPTPQNSQGDIIEKAQEMSENWIEKGFGRDIPKQDKKPVPPSDKESYRVESVVYYID